jgi:cytochrome d ubiquinol oxidase subunit I
VAWWAWDLSWRRFPGSDSCYWRRQLESARWFLWAAFLSFPTGFIAVLCGWYTAEVGRQPWVVYGILRTEDAITPSLTGGQVLFSLIAYVVVYAVIYAFGLTYIYRVLKAGPTTEPSVSRLTPGRPIAVALRGRPE